MKRVLLLCVIIFPLTVAGQDLPKSEFNLSLGYLFEGELYLAEFNAYGSFGETFLLKGNYVGYINDNFGIGGYLSFGRPWYGGYEEVSMTELGLVFMTRFAASEQMLVKPSANLGFRSFSEEGGSGFAIDLSVAFQYQLEKVRPYFELGIISQPAGGNDDTDITFAPIFQMSAGISF